MSVRTAAPQQSSRTAIQSDASSQALSAKAQLLEIQGDLKKFLYENENATVANALDKLEQKTGAKREYVSYGLAGLVALYLILGSSAELVANLIGVVYPIRESFKSIREQKEDHNQWLTYWAIFGVLTFLDAFAEGIYQVFPLIYLVKAVFLFYLYLPQMRGASVLYARVVDPAVNRIDELLKSRSAKA